VTAVAVTVLAELLRRTTGTEPLLSLGDDDTGEAFVILPNQARDGLVVGIIDADAGCAVMLLPRENVQQLRDVCATWLEARD
jgi:hypothetical protein